MKYRIDKGTPTFSALMGLKRRWANCSKEAIALMKELYEEEMGEPGGHRYFEPMNSISGGIGGIEMPRKPEGWVVAHRKMPGTYIPGKKHPRRKDIDALPVVTYDDLNGILGYPAGFSRGKELRYTKGPGFSFHKNYCLVETPEWLEWTPGPDLVEITVSEYKQLKTRP